ncbi:hypothetical protein [Actinoplanes couchii]|nr:hypothetical protein [Actinoplanes couchii]MDR6324436.1 hypothetical protein [Actinoplanes couchii]
MAQDSMISFGDAGDDAKPRRTFRYDLGRDHRIPGLVAGLGALAAFGSLISEWQTTTMNGATVDPAFGGRMLPTELTDLGAVGAGYLVGLLLLTTAVVLKLFGPESGRRHARLAGFSAGGVLLTLLTAMTHHVGKASLLIPRYYTIELTGDDIQVAAGRGLWCALFAVTAALIAIGLPHREKAPVTPAEPELDEEPLDLTITPTAPFASMDQPPRS